MLSEFFCDYLGDDLPLVLRIVIQCMLPGAPNDLSVEAQNLANKVTALVSPAEHDGISSALQERCPACGVEIPLTDIAVATCSNGHRWRESLMTSIIRPLSSCRAGTASPVSDAFFLH